MGPRSERHPGTVGSSRAGVPSVARSSYPQDLTGAHRTLLLGSKVRVANLHNGRSVRASAKASPLRAEGTSSSITSGRSGPARSTCRGAFASRALRPWRSAGCT